MQATKTLKALVVDDNYFNRDLCKLALDHAGFDSIEAENGAEALSILQNQEFDVLILDLAMPEMDGITLLNELKRLNIRAGVCTIVITANSHMATEEVEIGADYVLYKPIDIQFFTQLLQRLKS